MTMTGHFGLFFLVLWPIISAFVSYLIGRKNKKIRNYFANFATILEFAMVLMMAISANNEHPPVFELNGFMGFRIFLEMDGFRCIYAIITALMWMMTTIFSREYFAHYRNRNRYYFFMLLTFAGTMGVFLSSDLITTFLFFEMMSFTSYVMVLHDEKPAAIEASKTYMAVAVIGGLAMLFGIFIVNNELHTTEIGAFVNAMHHFEGNKNMLYLAAAFMLVGFGGKAGMYPLHIWLPNAHPVAPAPASALLSGVLTKTGVFGIIVVSALIFQHDYTWGMIILNIGVLGMFTGALLALFSIDLKRTLACSSMSQIGFILVGIGMQGILAEENALAVRGTMLHMVNHSLIKLVLFMVAGVVYMNLHQLDLNKVRGFGRGKPLITFCFLMGVLGIIGLPFWNGYISKTMLHESIVEKIWLFPEYSSASTYFRVVESIFTLTGGLTTAYMIKIFTCVCIEKNQFDQGKLTALNKKYMTKTTAVVLFLSALILPILGFSPNTFMIPISGFAQEFMHGENPAHAVEFFAWANLRGAVASLSIGAIIYIFVVRGLLMARDEEGRSVYINAWPAPLNIENKVYKPLLLNILPFIGALIARFVGSILPSIASLGYKLFMKFRNMWVSDTKDMYPKVRSLVDLSGEVVEFEINNIFEEMRFWARNIYWTGCRLLNAVNTSQEISASTPASPGIAGLLRRILEPSRNFYNSIGKHFHFPIPTMSKRFHFPGEGSDVQPSRSNEFIRVVFGSLSYSLLLLLFGVIVILAFVLFR